MVNALRLAQCHKEGGAYNADYFPKNNSVLQQTVMHAYCWEMTNRIRNFPTFLTEQRKKESSPVTVAACICSIKPFPVLELGLDDMGRFFLSVAIHHIRKLSLYFG